MAAGVEGRGQQQPGARAEGAKGARVLSPYRWPMQCARIARPVCMAVTCKAPASCAAGRGFTTTRPSDATTSRAGSVSISSRCGHGPLAQHMSTCPGAADMDWCSRPWSGVLDHSVRLPPSHSPIGVPPLPAGDSFLRHRLGHLCKRLPLHACNDYQMSVLFLLFELLVLSVLPALSGLPCSILSTEFQAPTEYAGAKNAASCCTEQREVIFGTRSCSVI